SFSCPIGPGAGNLNSPGTRWGGAGGAGRGTRRRWPALPPGAVRDLGDELQLALLRVLGDRVARARRREPTLRGQRELVARVEVGGLVDPGQEILGGLELVELGRDQPQHDDLVVGQPLEWLKRAR